MTLTRPEWALSGPPTDDEIRAWVRDGKVTTADQAADYLEVSRITIRTLVAKGELRPVKRGIRPLLVHWDDIYDLRIARRDAGRRQLTARMTRA